MNVELPARGLNSEWNEGGSDVGPSGERCALCSDEVVVTGIPVEYSTSRIDDDIRAINNAIDSDVTGIGREMYVVAGDARSVDDNAVGVV